MSQKTKTRILETALRLFNDRGSGNVSTRHVADELGMSPGNLYYHYANKEAIVRALFARLDGTWDEAYRFSLDEPLTLGRVAEMLSVTFEIVWRYRFFFREMTLLVHNDPALAGHYWEVRERSLKDTRFVLACAVDAELLLPQADGALDRLTEALVVVSNHWLSFEEMGGDPRNTQNGVELLLSLLEPHLTPHAARDLATLLSIQGDAPWKTAP